MTYRPKHILEYALLRIFATLFSLLPYRLALAIGWLIAGAAFHIFGFRKQETLRRMKLAFGNRFTEKQYRSMAWISCRNMMFNVIEILRATRATLPWCNRVYEYAEPIAALHQHLKTGRGAILACPHMGNWDLAGFAYSLNHVPTFSLVARQRNPLVNNYFDRIRSTPDSESLSRGTPGVLKIIARRLKAGEVFAILPDARMNTPGVAVPLLGGTANLGTGMATFARMAKVPIFPILISRKGWSRHTIQQLDPVEPDMTLDKQTDVHRMTTVIMKQFDHAIHAAPEQWFWFNKRWVLDPVKPAQKEDHD